MKQGAAAMTYVPTPLKKEIVIDSIITIHYFEYMRDFVFRGESHDFWEFLYVDRGTVLVTAGESNFQLTTGNIIFHKPKEFHAIRSIEKNSPNLMTASFTSASPAMKLLEGKIDTLSIEERNIISHLLGLARQSFATPLHVPSVEQILLKPDLPFGTEQLIGADLELLLISLIRKPASPAVRRIPASASVSEENSRENRLDRILSFMEEHICEQLTVEQICSAFSLSRSSLQSLFHEKKGCGVMDYFIHRKIDRAKEMIRDGTMNVTEISYFLSYSSLQYFSKQFKQITGMSPQQYASSVKGLSQSAQGSFIKPKLIK